MRLLLAFCTALLLSTSLHAGADSLDSLPTPVQSTLQTLLQDPKTGVGGVEIYQWGISLAYKVIVTRDGHPYLEVHIEDTGQLVRCDPIPQTAADNKDTDHQASPSPSASPGSR